jgi:heat shock protein HtpX
VNNLKVFVLLAGMVALFGVVGGMLGGQTGMLLSLVIAAVMSGVMYFNAGRMALRAYRAQVVGREQAPEIYEIVDRRAYRPARGHCAGLEFQPRHQPVQGRVKP